MISVSGIRIPVSALDGDRAAEEALAIEAARRRLHLPAESVTYGRVERRSIDARRGRGPTIEFRARLELSDARLERRVAGGRDARSVRIVALTHPSWPSRPRHRGRHRPVVVGAGCAGLFCALALAEAGLEPLLIEQGDDCARRTRKVGAFASGGALDVRSNIQFGLGGAGTFSDGKLSTGTRDASHELILDALVAAGAPREILVDAKPHIGSDILPSVVEALAARIEALGGEVRLRTILERLVLSEVGGRHVSAIEVATATSSERIEAESVVLATGHSARDVFSGLATLGVGLLPKPFAVGVRIEHSQREVDRARFGRDAGHPALGAATYDSAVRTSTGLRLFTFCMCPGGRVVAAASEPSGVVTNGASDSGRDAPNANAALLVNVNAEAGDALAGVELQRRIERAAFAQGGGDYTAPAQLVGDLLAGEPSTGPGSVVPSYPRGVAWGALDDLLPAPVIRTLREGLPLLARRLPFFANGEAVLTAPETRSSSPVRIPRGDRCAHPDVQGLYPCGEGGGWAGGIMSAAADGVRVARAIVANLDEA